MSSKDEKTPIRERWTAQASSAGEVATAGALLRSAADYSPIADWKLERIRARLRQNERARPCGGGRHGSRLARQLAAAAALMLLGGALYASAMHVLYKTPRPSTESPKVGAGAGLKPARRASVNRPSTGEPMSRQEPPATLAPAMPAAPMPAAKAPVAPVERPPAASELPLSTGHPSRSSQLLAHREAFATPGSAQVRGPSESVVPGVPPADQRVPAMPSVEQSVRALPPVEPPASSTTAPRPAFGPTAGPSRLVQDSRAIAEAIARLRQGGQPAQALAILDQHRAELALGPLAPEATSTRMEALLKLGRNGEALSLLDAQHLTAKGPDREMLVARAELRADKARWVAALRDFDQLLSSSGQTDPVNERALFGRANCRAKTGDQEGSRRDFESYLVHFPHGRFVAQARAALDVKPR